MYPIGELPGGQIWSNGNSFGMLTSAPGFDMDLNAKTLHMDDFTVMNSKDSPYELSARGMLETDDGYFIGVTGKGPLENTPHVQALIANETGVKATRWGELETLTTWSFQASGPYAALTDSTFFASIRLSPSNSSDIAAYAEYRLSKVLPGPLCESEWEGTSTAAGEGFSVIDEL